MNLNHKILIIDAELESPLNFKLRRKITKTFIDEILNTLKMKPLGSLQIYDALDNNFPGWSFVQPITTSHISGHYFENVKKSHIHLDFYSCKTFKWQDALSCSQKNFGFGKWRATLVDRSMSLSRNTKQYKGLGGLIED